MIKSEVFLRYKIFVFFFFISLLNGIHWSLNWGEKRRRLTDNLKVSLTAPHRIRINLAHVPATIDLLNVLYLQIPSPLICVREGYTWILRYHIVMYGQYCLCINSNPRHLKQEEKRKKNYTYCFL